jgi:hypothetical protein
LLLFPSTFLTSRYPPFVAAEVPEQEAVAKDSSGGGSSSSQSSLNPAETWHAAYHALRGYFSGGNSSRTKVEMTVPVYKDSPGVMRWYLGADYQVGFRA